MKYTKGIIYREKNHTLKTYDIDERGNEFHYGKISVYGDIRLRDKIIKLLNKAAA